MAKPSEAHHHTTAPWGHPGFVPPHKGLPGAIGHHWEGWPQAEVRTQIEQSASKDVCEVKKKKKHVWELGLVHGSLVWDWACFARRRGDT